MTHSQKMFEKVFLENAWGNKQNAGKYYVRPYSKTKKQRRGEDD